MKKLLFVLFSALVVYVFAFGITIIAIIYIGQPPSWLAPIVEFIFAPIIGLFNYFFGGIC